MKIVHLFSTLRKRKIKKYFRKKERKKGRKKERKKKEKKERKLLKYFDLNIPVASRQYVLSFLGSGSLA